MSSTVSRVEALVISMLAANDMRAVVRGEEYALRFSSAMVLVGFIEMGAQVIVTLRAPVLSEVSSPPEGRERILTELNRRNCDTHFGKWAFYEDTRVIAIEYDLLGDHLQESELLTAVAAVGRLADQADDELKQRLGTGRRAHEGA